MEKLGLRGQVHTLLTSYLTNRKQKTKTLPSSDKCICFSDEDTVTCGIPQGTVLGPFCFNLILNDLLTLKLSSKINAFADDTILICRGSTRAELYESANNDLKIVKSWMNDNLLTLNLKKTYYIEFTNSQTNIQTDNYRIEGIQRVDSAKYLGLIIDKKLNWQEQINTLILKLRKSIYKFVQVRNIVDEHLLRAIYFALIQSHLQYGIIAWGASYKNELERLIKIQKKILKIMYKKPKLFPTEELFHIAKVPTINKIFTKQSLIQLYKNKLLGLHPEVSHEHGTRYKERKPLLHEKPRTSKTKNTAQYKALSIYNDLPRNLKDGKSLRVFITKASQHLNLF